MASASNKGQGRAQQLLAIKHIVNAARNRLLLKIPKLVHDVETDARWNPFKNCLGALDGTYIRMQVLGVDKPRYRTRKGEIATNVLGVCERNMIHEWEGSASDSRVLRDALSRTNGLIVPRVDAGYAIVRVFLTPYRGASYHIEERDGRRPRNREQYFNMKHASARNVIERCFGVLKGRWAILRSPFYPVDTQTQIILACCLLHNLIRREMSQDPMEQQVNLNCNGMDSEDSGRKKRERRTWTDEQEDTLINILEEIVANGYARKNGTFKPGTSTLIENALLEKFLNSGLKYSPHVESKIKDFKKKYAHHSEADGWKGKPFPRYEAFSQIFGVDRAIGNAAKVPAAIVDEVNEELGNPEQAGTFDSKVETDQLSTAKSHL
ncbi:hypothetical protein ACLB2K_047049 [Fragaria x ananassa]